MSPRKRGAPATARQPVRRTEVPALADFFTGYLHQDVLEEHGSPEAALQSFIAAAASTERQALVDDWRVFHARTAAWPLAALRRAVADLGSAWIPPTRSRLETLFAAVFRPD